MSAPINEVLLSMAWKLDKQGCYKTWTDPCLGGGGIPPGPVVFRRAQNVVYPENVAVSVVYKYNFAVKKFKKKQYLKKNKAFKRKRNRKGWKGRAREFFPLRPGFSLHGPGPGRNVQVKKSEPRQLIQPAQYSVSCNWGVMPVLPLNTTGLLRAQYRLLLLEK